MKPSSVPALLVSASVALLSIGLSAQHPVVPGVERLRLHESSTPVERGAVLLAELSCTACHAAPGSSLRSRPAPDLRQIGARVTTSWLRRFLLDPHKTKPGTLMPRWNPAADDGQRRADVEALVHFLAARSGPLPAARSLASTHQVAAGKKLFHAVGCVACHAPEDGRKTGVASVPLGALAPKTTVDALRKFLADPHAVRPASRMPNLRLQEDEAQALAMYLLREQIDNPQSVGVKPPSRQGLHYAYYEIDVSAMPDFDAVQPAAAGQVGSVTLGIRGLPRGKRFALRLRGEIDVPEAGAYTFWVRSDDGSRLLIDGDPVVVDGSNERSGLIELQAGRRSFELEYFQWEGGKRLDAFWSGPGFGRRRIPGKVFSNRLGRAMVPLQSPSASRVAVIGKDRYLVARGRQLFAESGCTACHEPGTQPPPAKPLADCDPVRAGGCLDAEPSGCHCFS